MIHVEAYAVIAHVEHELSVMWLRGKLDLGSVFSGSELPGMVQQVGECNPQETGITTYDELRCNGKVSPAFRLLALQVTGNRLCDGAKVNRCVIHRGARHTRET